MSDTPSNDDAPTGGVSLRDPSPGAAPLSILDADELAATGATSLGDALQQVPWQSNATNLQFNNGGDGTSRISLRGLGATRTLVLINGRRHVAGGTGANESVDLEAIPLALVDRVEILRGGGATIHGGGAVGGVVNVITKHDLDGVEAALHLGATQDLVDVTRDASVALGKRLAHGHVMAAVGYRDTDAIGAGDRDFSRNDKRFDFATGEISSVGSSATPQGTLIDRTGAAGNAEWQRVIAASPGGLDNGFYNDPVVGWREFAFTGNSDDGTGDFFNYQPDNYLVTPQERAHGFASGHYRIGPVRGFGEASFLRRRSEQQVAPTPLFTITNGLTVSADNVYNPFGRDFIDIRRRMVEAGPRRFTQEADTLRLVAGVDGELPQGWGWELSYSYGRTESTNERHGALQLDRLAAALGPSFVDEHGQPRCGTPTSPLIDGCVPLNLFGGPGTITPEMLAYLRVDTVDTGLNEQHVARLRVHGDLLRADTGAGVAVSAGVEHREESGAVIGDPNVPSDNTTGATTASFEGGYQARAAYVEVIAAPIEGLALTGAARAFDYNSFGTGTSWEIGGAWRLPGGISVRARQAHAFRPPGLRDLHLEGQDTVTNLSDPCDTSQGPRTPNQDINCTADGLPSDYVDTRFQLPTRTGGNLALQPEVARIRTAGIEFAPSAAPGLAVSADYFDISVDDLVTETNAALILENCYARAPSERSNCDRITRDPDTGQLALVDSSFINGGGLDTAGVDLELSYRRETSLGRFSARLSGTWLAKYDRTDLVGSVIAGKGVYDLGVHPERKGEATVAWHGRGLGAGVHVRWLDGFIECEDNFCLRGTDPDGNPMLNPDDPPPLSREIDAYEAVDAFASYTASSALGHSTLTVGVRNLFDRAPPVIFNGFLASSDAATYDFAGRSVYARFVQGF
ncbi:TonB-dependent receptor domain-containing protein [Haliangium sp.]|uniref:TonB-dependent receptor domain-containing protein n=1 Tax=Haliangium sp. TaxID=2663208 RepID=UPI003D0E8B65